MPPNIQNANAAGTGFMTWYTSMPPITRTYATLVFAVTAVNYLGILSAGQLALIWPLVFQKLEVWRLVTNFLFIGKFSFSFVIKLIWILTYGAQLETTTFQFDPADYLYMLMFGCGGMLLSSVALHQYFYGNSVVFMLLYVWSRNFPEQKVSIMGLVTVMSFYLPFAFVGMSIVMGQDPIPDIIGIVIGHLYFFLKVLYPATSGRQLLTTPQFLRNWLASRGLGVPTITHAAAGQPDFRPFRGAGMRLGGD